MFKVALIAGQVIAISPAFARLYRKRSQLGRSTEHIPKPPSPFARGTDAAGTRTHTGSIRTHFCDNCVKLHRIALLQPHRLDPELLPLAFRPVTIHATEISPVVLP